MIGQKDLSLILHMALPPAPTPEQPEPARSLKGAIRNLDREAELLLLEARSHPVHQTLQELSARMR